MVLQFSISDRMGVLRPSLYFANILQDRVQSLQLLDKALLN